MSYLIVAMTATHHTHTHTHTQDRVTESLSVSVYNMYLLKAYPIAFTMVSKSCGSQQSAGPICRADLFLLTGTYGSTCQFFVYCVYGT